MSLTNQSTADRLRSLIDGHPELADRLVRELLTLLHTRGIATVDRIYDEARLESGGEPVDRETEEDHNRPASLRWEGGERHAVREVTLRHAAASLTADEVEDLLHQVRRREAAEGIEGIANLPGVPFRLLADRVREFCALPPSQTISRSGYIGTRVALIRNFISDQLEFIGVAKNYLRITDIGRIVDRVIGSDTGQGRIGGKAAGCLLGYRILQGVEREHEDDPTARVLLPESWFLRSDVIEEFLRHNRLEEYQHQKYKEPEQLRNEHPLVRQHFHNAEFPPGIVRKLEKMLEQVGHHPLIVRSSSLLEDRFGAAFSGMYASVFLGNQGSLKDRLRALLDAVADVFASTIGPDPIVYRRRHNLIDYHEDMAVLIQKVVGRPHGRFFLPDLAGVAFSRNEYRWSPRIRKEDGMARVVLGLGTRAVDRTGDDYSRIVALGAPSLRPEVMPDRIIRYSQRNADVIDLEADGFRRVPIADLLAEGPDVPGIQLAASIVTGGSIVEPVGGVAGVDPKDLCLTFDRLVQRTPFAARMREQLKRLEDAYRVPVNVEYAISGSDVYLLQCRPLVQAEAAEFIRLPRHIPPSDQFFFTRETVRSGEVRDVEYVVFVDPQEYQKIGSRETRARLGRTVGRVNDALEGKTFILIGPGRWGSNDSSLGVRVSYSDINHCAVLVEIARSQGGFVPELSYGTHFFQDLVEDGIFYLPLYPEERGVLFNEELLRRVPNCLGSLVPRDAKRERFVRVVRVADAAPGKAMHLVMDGDAGESMCWLE